MAKQIILIFCEGPHDVAFISRVLKVIGLNSNDSMKLGDYPPPLNQFLEKEAVKSDVAGLNLSEIRNNLLPSKTFSINESLVFLYSLGGDSKKVSRKDLFGKFIALIPYDNEISKERFTTDTELSVLYLFDADERGVSERLNDISEEIKELLNEINELEGEV